MWVGEHICNKKNASCRNVFQLLQCWSSESAHFVATKTVSTRLMTILGHSPCINFLTQHKLHGKDSQRLPPSDEEHAHSTVSLRLLLMSFRHSLMEFCYSRFKHVMAPSRSGNELQGSIKGLQHNGAIIWPKEAIIGNHNIPTRMPGI